MIEALCSSETSVLTIVVLRNIPEDGILHIYGPPQRLTGRVSHLLYVSDVCIPQETHIWASTTYYEDNFTSYFPNIFVVKTLKTTWDSY
jgi:hypothetical protein